MRRDLVVGHHRIFEIGARRVYEGKETQDGWDKDYHLRIPLSRGSKAAATILGNNCV
jgi:hypothetical protein